MFKGLAIALFVGTTLLGWVARADDVRPPAEIIAVMSGDKPVYTAALAALQHNLPQHIQIHGYSLGDWRKGGEALRAGKPGQIWVAIGAAAAAELLHQDAAKPTLSIMVPSTTYSRLLEQRPAAEGRNEQRRYAAIYMDQPAERQINLARLVQPDVKSIGTLFDEGSEKLARSLVVTALNSGLKFSALQLNEKDNPLVALREMYSQIDLYIAVPGEFIFNRSIAKWMLYLSLRNKKPLLGFSEEFVHAGALAAVYSTPQDIGRQAGELIGAYLETGRFDGASGFPAYFRVSVNRNVAGLLGLDLASDDLLTWELGKREMDR